MGRSQVEAQKKENGKQVHVNVKQKKNDETLVTETVFNSKSITREQLSSSIFRAERVSKPVR
jgi:hypothetical protein